MLIASLPVRRRLRASAAARRLGHVARRRLGGLPFPALPVPEFHLLLPCDGSSVRAFTPAIVAPPMTIPATPAAASALVGHRRFAFFFSPAAAADEPAVSAESVQSAPASTGVASADGSASVAIDASSASVALGASLASGALEGSEEPNGRLAPVGPWASKSAEFVRLSLSLTFSSKETVLF